MSMSYRLYHLLWAVLDLLLPPVCGGCEKPGFRWCPQCQGGVTRLDSPICEICGDPLSTTDLRCNECRTRPPNFRALRSWSAFEGPVRNALLHLKYRRDIGFGEALTPQLSDFVGRLHWPIDLVVAVPLGRKRLEQRGYNQAALIAWPLAMALGADYGRGSVMRVRETVSQVGLTRTERRNNVDAAFRAEQHRVHGRCVLLVDDVATTGSTLSSCAEALYTAEARDVFGLTVARAVRSAYASGTSSTTEDKEAMWPQK